MKKFTWVEEKDPGVADEVLVCLFDGVRIGRLHHYHGVGYFAYFRELQLNRSPIESLEAAKGMIFNTFVGQDQANSGASV